MDTAAYFRDYDNIQDSSTISARLTLALYLLYGVLVNKGSDSELVLHMGDFGKNRFDGAGPSTPSDSHGDISMIRISVN